MLMNPKNVLADEFDIFLQEVINECKATMFTPRRIIPPPEDVQKAARDLTELPTAETEGGMKCVNPGPELPAAEVVVSNHGQGCVGSEASQEVI